MPHHLHTRVSPPNNTPFYIIQSVSCHHYITLPLSTWLNLSRATSLLGLCALLWMIKPSASPSSKTTTSMVVVLFASLQNLEFSSFHSPSQPFLLCLQNLPLQTVFWPVIAFLLHKSGTLLLSITALAFKLVYTPPTPPSQPHVCMCEPVSVCSLLALCACDPVCVCGVCVCVWVHMRIHVCVIFCVVFLPCFVWKCLLIFICFVHLYTTDLYSYGYLHCTFFFKL